MSNRFSVTDTPLVGVRIVRRLRVEDRRGYFERLFCSEELAAAGWSHPVAQVNRSLSRQLGTVRGMHFQYPPYAEMKLVTCVQGAVFDVAVDLRAQSPTLLRWHGEILSADNCTSMLVPEGCAHGVQMLTADAELVYLTSSAYRPDAESGIHPLDPAVGIVWPLPISELSERDANHRMLERNYVGITV